MARPWWGPARKRSITRRPRSVHLAILPRPWYTGAMNFPALIIGSYGALSLAGGAIGYAKARSRASLIAGSTSGALLIACAIGLQHGHRAAAVAGGVTALALGARFFAVWLQKRRVMPDLIMVLGATVTVVAAGAALR